MSGRRGLRGKDREMEFFIVFKSGLCVFQLLLGYLGIFFG